MITYIPQNSIRDQFLLSLSIQNNKNSSIAYFLEHDIYETCLGKKADIVILDDHNLTNPHISNIISNIENNEIDIKTKIIILSEQPQKYLSKNIVCIPKKTYVCFNEAYQPTANISYKYILCHLDNKNIDNNFMIESILYPSNQSVAVKIVNCSIINHPQNLGIVSEKDMLDLINNCFAYVCVSDDYLYDAIRMNKKVVCCKENNFIPQNTNPLSIDIIENTPNALDLCNITSINAYSLSNIVKHIVKI